MLLWLFHVQLVSLISDSWLVLFLCYEVNDENLNVDSDLDDRIENSNATVAIEDDGLVLMNNVLSCHDA